MTLKTLTATILTLFIASCGGAEDSSYDPVDVTDQINRINDKISALTILAGDLDDLVRSDYATCPASGDTADPLIRKICEVAQAATIELQVELSNQIGNFASQLQSQITTAQDDLSQHQQAIDAANANIASNSASIATNAAAIAAAQASITTISGNITTLQGQVSTLQAQMTSANAAILALQNLTASISGTLNGVMISIAIGEENSSAGPYYEMVLRRVDKTRFNGYESAYGAYKSLGNNPLTASNGSSTLTVNLTAHGYSSGDIIELSGLTAGSRGLITSDVTGQFTIVTAAANSFTITMPHSATSNGTLGGANGLVRKYNGSGMATFWTSGQVSDSAVRTTNAGSKPYNFIVRRRASDVTNNTAELCYDKTNRSATFATINAAAEGGAGNIVCK